MKLELYIDNDYCEMWSLKPEYVNDRNQSLHFSSRNEALYAQKVIEGWANTANYSTKDILGLFVQKD